jgi:hypothetical protein
LPAERDAAVEIEVEDRLLLLLRHRPLVEIGALVGDEALAVLGSHQRHAELVEVIAPSRLLGIEEGRPGDIPVALVTHHRTAHVVASSGQ